MIYRIERGRKVQRYENYNLLTIHCQHDVNLYHDQSGFSAMPPTANMMSFLPSTANMMSFLPSTANMMSFFTLIKAVSVPYKLTENGSFKLLFDR